MNGYTPSSACGRGCLPRPGATPGRAWPARVPRLVAVLLSVVVGGAVAMLIPMTTPPARATLVRGWARTLLGATGVRLVVRGTAPGPTRLSARAGAGHSPVRPGTLVVANHVSWLDIPALLAVEPLRIVAKSDVRGWPVVGRLAARAGTVFIDRGRLLRLPQTVAEIAATLREGTSVLVFPEGSTWCGRTQGRFYPAAFQAAVDAGAPVRPVALRYRLSDGSATTAAAFLGSETLLASLLRVIATRGLTVEMEIGGLLTTTGPGSSTAEGTPGHEARRALARAAAGPRPPSVTHARQRDRAAEAVHRLAGLR